MINKFNIPIVVFDIESTGTSPAKDKIVAICCKRILPTGEIKTAYSLINPEIPIPPSATECHKITDEMVALAPKFKQISKALLETLNDAAVITYNGNSFDIILLAEEFARVGISWPHKDMLSLDACTIFKKHEERTLKAALKFFCDKEHDNAHSAEADVQATFEVFSAQLERYPDMGEMTIQELHDYCVYDPNRVDLDGKLVRNEAGVIVWAFGKHKDKPVVDNRSYCDWVLSGDFTMQTKAIVQSILDAQNPPNNQQTLL